MNVGCCEFAGRPLFAASLAHFLFATDGKFDGWIPHDNCTAEKRKWTLVDGFLMKKEHPVDLSALCSKSYNDAQFSRK